MKKIVVFTALLMLLSGCCNRNSMESTQEELVNNEGQEDKELFQTISWDNLLSSEEVQYYIAIEAAYNADPSFVPTKQPPPPRVNPEVNGLKIKLPGYIVGIDSDPKNFSKVNSFFFVPYQGACIHVPPPPPNLTIYTEVGKAIETNPFEAYWVFGTIQIEEGSNDLGSYSYTLKAEKIEVYINLNQY